MSDKVLVYLNDVLILAATVYVLLETHEQVFGFLAKAKLKCKPSKCFLYAGRIYYLRHVVSNARISPQKNKFD